MNEWTGADDAAEFLLWMVLVIGLLGWTRMVARRAACKAIERERRRLAAEKHKDEWEARRRPLVDDDKLRERVETEGE